MFLVGGSALTNKNSVPVQDSPQTQAVQVRAADPAAVNVSALEQRIAEYQAREKQYQSELNDAAQQLDQANQQVQQFQQLLTALQRRGVIRIDRSGQIFIPRGSGDDGGSPSGSQSAPQGQEGL